MEMDDKLLKLVDVAEFEIDKQERIKNYLQKLKRKETKVEHLKKEVIKIKDTVSSLEVSTQESAFANYSLFINSRFFFINLRSLHIF